jgi:hypothetical protein
MRLMQSEIEILRKKFKQKRKEQMKLCFFFNIKYFAFIF